MPKKSKADAEMAAQEKEKVREIRKKVEEIIQHEYDKILKDIGVADQYRMTVPQLRQSFRKINIQDVADHDQVRELFKDLNDQERLDTVGVLIKGFENKQIRKNIQKVVDDHYDEILQDMGVGSKNRMTFIQQVQSLRKIDIRDIADQINELLKDLNHKERLETVMELLVWFEDKKKQTGVTFGIAHRTAIYVTLSALGYPKALKLNLDLLSPQQNQTDQQRAEAILKLLSELRTEESKEAEKNQVTSDAKQEDSVQQELEAAAAMMAMQEEQSQEEEQLQQQETTAFVQQEINDQAAEEIANSEILEQIKFLEDAREYVNTTIMVLSALNAEVNNYYLDLAIHQEYQHKKPVKLMHMIETKKLSEIEQELAQQIPNAATASRIDIEQINQYIKYVEKIEAKIKIEQKNYIEFLSTPNEPKIETEPKIEADPKTAPQTKTALRKIKQLYQKAIWCLDKLLKALLKLIMLPYNYYNKTKVESEYINPDVNKNLLLPSKTHTNKLHKESAKKKIAKNSSPKSAPTQ